jgi:serine phosphatase RsbU (regulator of sigma subunit)
VEGIPLGLIPGAQRPVLAERGAPQTWGLLIIHTDGISESTNEAGEELGYEGLMRLAGICRCKLSIQ